MSLPLLPDSHIKDNFNRIKMKIPDSSVKLRLMADYMGRLWMELNIYSMNNLSVCGQSIRINNGCEGYHYRLKDFIIVIFIFNFLSLF